MEEDIDYPDYKRKPHPVIVDYIKDTVTQRSPFVEEIVRERKAEYDSKTRLQKIRYHLNNKIRYLKDRFVAAYKAFKDPYDYDMDY